MTLYTVWHKTRSKRIEIDIHPADEWKISRKVPGFLMDILKTYKKETGYIQFIHYNGLVFEKLQEIQEVKEDKSQPQDFLGPCEKDWCNHCRKGDFEKCPNRH